MPPQASSSSADIKELFLHTYKCHGFSAGMQQAELLNSMRRYIQAAKDRNRDGLSPDIKNKITCSLVSVLRAVLTILWTELN